MITFYDVRSGLAIPFDPDNSVVGYLPAFLSEDDPRPAREQVHENYAHGGGWHPFTGFRFTDRALYYPDDPPLPCLAVARLHDEVLRFYVHAWLAIVQKDSSVEIARID